MANYYGKGVSGSIQEKNGYLYLVVSYNDIITKKRKTKWIALHLKTDASKSVINKAKRDAQAEFEEEYNREMKGFLSPEQYPFLDFLNKWLETVQIHKIQPTTIAGYRTMLHGRITRFFGDALTLSDITPRRVNLFYDNLREDGVGECTILKYHNFLHGAFEYAVRQEIFPSNPMNRVERPSPKKFVGKFYSVEELRTLLALTEDDPIYLPIVLAAYYGVRRSEAIGLSWSNVDFKNKFIYIRQKAVDTRDKNGKMMLFISSEMKNESSRRTLPLIPEVEAILLSHREKQKEYRQLFKNDYCRDYLDMVCVNPMGELLRPDYVTARFPEVLKKYNLRKIRFHDLRHSCASLLLSKNVNMKIIQMWLGHSSMKTTSDIYSHLEASSKEKAGQILENLLGINDNDDSKE